MAYAYEINKIWDSFNPQDLTEFQEKSIKDRIWKILDNLADSEYARGMDSVRCYEDCCY